MLTRAVLLMCLLAGGVVLTSPAPSVAQELPPPTAVWSFDDPQNGEILEEQSGTRIAVKTPFHPYEAVEGPVNQSFRSDGYSTWFDTAIPTDQQPREALTTEAWVALESYPVTNAPLVNKYTFPGAGYFFGMDPWGQWYLAVSINGEWYTCWGDAPLPKEEWVHVAGTFDSATGTMRVYLNGTVAGSTSVPAAPLTVDTDTRTTVARDIHSPTTAGMATGHLNGALDEIAIYNDALSASQVATRARRGTPPAPPNLAVPPSRFAEDPHRPAFHAMPSANWTNEPHGLVLHDGTYHLFHQRNPNGPYFQRLRWGHLTSDDLVHWTEQPVAITSQANAWDKVGNWSGDAVSDGDTLTAVYTGVDGVKAGIGLAREQADGSFHKPALNPVIPEAPEGTRDFRDPYVFQDDDTWHALIGSGFQNAGGAALHYTSSDLEQWTYQGAAFEAPKEQAGTFWEMPVLMPLGNGKYVFEITTVEENAPARGLYWIGTWDGHTFTPDHEEPRTLDLINHMLSPTIARDKEGRIVAIGIVPDTRSTEAMKSAGWAHTFSLPRTWRLCDGDLCQAPAPQLTNLRGPHWQRTGVEVGTDNTDELPGVEGTQLEVKAVFSPEATGTYGVEVRASPNGEERTRIAYDSEAQELVVNLQGSTLNSTISNAELRRVPYEHPPGEPLTLHVFVDHSVLEVFVDNREAFSTRIYPTLESSTEVDLFTTGSSVTAQRIDVWRLAGDEPFPEPPTETGDAGNVRLLPITPNPTRGMTTFAFEVPGPRHVTLSIYDLLGRKIETILKQEVDSGPKTLKWTPTSSTIVASGAYFVRLQTGEVDLTRKFVVIQ